MPMYSPSTIAKVGDLNPKRGIVCRTEVVDASAIATLGSTVNIFHVSGRIRIVSLDIESIAQFGAQAAVPQWRFVGVTPVVASTAFSAVHGTLSGLAVGKRVTLAGTALNTTPVEDAVAGITLNPPNEMDLGWDGGECYIALLGSTALTSGSAIVTLCYLPMSDGAGVEAMM